MALPLHAEFRTLPMLFYVPPLLPVMATVTQVSNREQAAKLDPIAKVWEDSWLYDTSTDELWGAIDQTRLPLKYLANLFAAGDEGKIKDSLKKLWAIRIYRRSKTVGDIAQQKADDALKDVGYTPEIADAIYYLTSLAKFDDRFAIPAAHREHAIEMLDFTGDRRGSSGFGFRDGTAVRGL
jgi:nitrate reductase beta subunit